MNLLVLQQAITFKNKQAICSLMNYANYSYEQIKRARAMFGQERAELVLAADAYLLAKDNLQDTFNRRNYSIWIERHFLNSGREYLAKIIKSGDKNRNGKHMGAAEPKKELSTITEEIIGMISQTHPSHYQVLTEEFPDLVVKKQNSPCSITSPAKKLE